MNPVVAVQGVNFVNKGAELMLYAIVQSLRDKKVTLATDLVCGSFRQRTELGLYHLLWRFIGRLPAAVSIGAKRVSDRIVSVAPQKMRYAKHILCDADVMAVLDASGFVYSDQTGVVGRRMTQYTAHNITKWKREGKKIIFLPQAFGPFHTAQTKHYVAQIIAHSDLIFARDTISHEHLLDLAVESQNVRVAPDFTGLIQGVCPDYFTDHVERPCIIPNCRMIDKTSSDTGEKYPSFLIECLCYLIEQGMQPFILIHEERDIAFATDIRSKLSKPVDIVQESNPVYIKGILGRCSLVISSRYHGLVSALSQAIPCLATSWSHKYQTLLEDYGCPEALLSVSASKDEIRDKIDMVNKKPTRSEFRTRLQRASQEQCRLTLDMWDQVYRVLLSG